MAADNDSSCLDFTELRNLDFFTPESDIEHSDPNDSDYVPESNYESDGSFIPVGTIEKKLDSNDKLLLVDVNSSQIPDQNDLYPLNSEHYAIDENSSQIPDQNDRYPLNSEHYAIDENSSQIPDQNNRYPLNSEHYAIDQNSSQIPDQNSIVKPKTKVDKRHYCIYCSKSFAKLKRHILSVHKNETEVVRISTNTGQKMKEEFCKMKNAGNHQHNLQVFRGEAGDLVVKKKVSDWNASNEDFVPCPRCLGYYYHRDLWRHNCPVPPESSKRNQLQRGRILRLTGTEEEKNMEEILVGLRNDPIALAAKHDPLIRIFAQRECNLHYHDRDRHAHTRNKVRELGRLLISLREVTGRNNLYLTDFISPEYYKHLVQATKQIAGFDYSLSIFKTPSVGLKIGYSMSRCADLLRAKAIETGDSLLREKCQDFFQMYSSRWNEDIANHALRSLKEGKRNNAKGVPLSEDIAALSTHLQKESESAKNKLQSATTIEDKKSNWESLAVVTLVRIIMFNRRRQGEASKVKVNDYLQGKEQNHSKDVLTNLSQFEQALCEKLCRIEVVGKRGRTVPIIFTESMKDSLECLLKFRNEVVTNENNHFIFARLNKESTHHIRGSDCLREVVKEIPLQQPDFIRSTALRKHIAIMTQLHNMKDNELDVLAQYMGHDIRIHREHYRLPSATIQVAKVAKFLLSMEQGHNSTEGEKEDDEDSTLEDDGNEGFFEPSPEKDSTTQPIGVKRKTRTANCMELKSKRKRANNTQSQKDMSAQIEKDMSAQIEKDMSAQIEKDMSAQIEKDMRAQSKRDMSARRGWSDAEKDFVMKHMGNFVYLETVPGKAAVEKAVAKDKNSVLAGRSWLQIKNYIRNAIVSRNKK